MPSIINIQKLEIDGSADAVTLPVSDSVEVYSVAPDTGSTVTLTGNVSYNPTGSPTPDGTRYTFEYAGGVTLDGNTLNFFGYSMNAAEALAKYIITATYLNGGYEVKLAFSANDGSATINGSEIQAGTIPASALPSAGVPLVDIANAAGEGRYIMSNSSNVRVDLDGSGNAQFPMGDGTGVNMVSMSGGGSMTNTGLFTLATGSVQTSALAFTISSPIITNLTIPTADVLTLFATPIQIVAAQGANVIIAVENAFAYMDYNSISYTGGTALELLCQGAVERQFADLSFLGLDNATGSHFVRETSNVALSDTQLIKNAPLMLQVPGAPPTAGNSDIKISVQYRLITF